MSQGRNTTTVAEAVAGELRAAGVTKVFGLPGGEVLVLMDALRRNEIEFALFRHESHAGMAAAVYGRLSGTPGVVVATLGPGACNLMLPIANSYLDCDPLLAISAQLPRSFPAAHTHQRLALEEVFRPITKFASSVSPASSRQTVRQAIDASCSEPMGPCYLTLSAEDAGSPAEDESSVIQDRRTARFDELLDPRSAASTIRKVLNEADRPLVIVGIGAKASCSEPLRRWLGRWSLAYAVTAKAKGMVDETSDSFVGVVGGMAMDAVLRDAIRNADLVLGVGLDPVEIDQTWHADTPIRWILEAPLATGRKPERQLIACLHRDVFEALAVEQPPRAWADTFADYRRRRWPAPRADGDDPRGIDPVAAIRTLGAAVPAETIVVTDVGSHKYLFGQFWPSRQPETFLVSNGLSAMGYGLPAAIGAKLARPDRPVLLAIGDGGFAMTCAELETAFRLHVPLVAVVLADQSYSLIRLAQESRRLPAFGVDFGPVDAIAIAEACGIAGRRATTTDELRDAVVDALASGRSLVVEVPVSIASYRGIV